jgi:hypothetical protein
MIDFLLQHQFWFAVGIYWCRGSRTAPRLALLTERNSSYHAATLARLNQFSVSLW